MSAFPSGSLRLEEALCEDAGYYLGGATLIERGRTPYQEYEVWQSPRFGRLFRLDGCLMTSERDEFFYHENLIHIPALAHPEPRRALIIGGGDGGSAEELFKYPSMERVVLVELDEQVVRIAREHLPAVHRGSLDDPRLEIRIEDGLRYVEREAQAGSAQLDLIVLDLTDPVGPAEALYAAPFLTQCKALLAEGGALSLHVGAPVFQPERVRALVETLRSVFQRVSPYFLYIPLYGSLWGMAVASDSLAPELLTAAEIETRLASRSIADLQYYNGDTHGAVFAQPNFIRTLLA